MLQKLIFRVNGRLVKVGLRQVHTPHRGYMVHHNSSEALLEIRKAEVVLRTAFGKWDIELLKAVKDYIEPK